MSTSDRVVVAEAAGAALLIVAACALLSSDDVWLRSLGLHPMWVPIILMGARYGARGLFPALGFTVGGLMVTGVVLEDSLGGLSARLQNPADMIALATAVLVAWVAMLHESRISRAVLRLTDATETQRLAEANVSALRASLGYLRSRQDRLDVALSLWRSLARRLERGEASEASRAALELCEIRAAARAGVVLLRDGARLSTLASRGDWPAGARGTFDLDLDPTVRAAIQSRHVTPAAPGAAVTDSDVAIPVTDEESGAVIGVIALRGVSPGVMRAADLRDLAVIAQWLAPTLAKQLRRDFGRAFAELSSPVRAPARKAEASV